MSNPLKERPNWVKKIAEEESHLQGSFEEEHDYYPGHSVCQVHKNFDRSSSRQDKSLGYYRWDVYKGDLSKLKQRAEENWYSTSDDDVSLSLKAWTSLHQSIERWDPYWVSICDLIAAKTANLRKLAARIYERANLIEQPEPPTIELHKPVPLYELFEDTKKHYLPSCTVAWVTFR